MALYLNTNNYSNSSSRSERYFLESCSYGQKDDAKKAGAKWDANAKKWYIPQSKMNQIELFNAWRPKGRIYLDCPFSAKDRAKQMGAKWDGDCKKWYFYPDKNRTQEQFQEWLPNQQSQSLSNDDTAKGTPIKSKNESKRAVEHTPSAASQQTSVKFLPRINEDMTLNELQLECRERDPSVKGISNKNKQWFLDLLGIGSVWVSATQDQNQSTSVTNASPKNTRTTSHSTSTTKESASKKRKLDMNPKEAAPSKKKGAKSAQEFNLSDLPRVTETMTLLQLSHELHHRDPSIRGASNKKKQWFLDQLGLGSILTSSPEAQAIDLESLPKISDSMTIAQLSHELLHRNPTQSGMSGKNKAWYLDRLCVGSIWMTGMRGLHSTQHGCTTKPPPSKERREERKTVTTSTVAATTTTTTTKAITDLRLQKMKEETKKVKQKVTNRKDTTNKKHANGTRNVHRATVADDHTIHPYPTTKTDTMLSSCKPETHLSSTDISARATAPSTVGSNSKVTSLNNVQDVPRVSKSMTLVELKDECKVRDPEVKCASKNKAWLLAYLGEGSEVEGSTQWQSKKKQEIKNMHIHKSLCHPHLLATSSQLPAPQASGTRCQANRTRDATCDVEHPWICQRTVYRTCIYCDFDICKACFEIESLPVDQKKTRLEEKYEEIRKEEERLQKEFQREQKRRREEHKRFQDEYKKERKERKRQLKRKYKNNLKKFPDVVKHPSPGHLDSDNKKKFTVWTSCGYDNDGWHSYDGPPRKEFNSSFDTLEEANHRVKYVFYFKNPWGSEKDDMFAEFNMINPTSGVRFMQCCPDDSERWTVSVVPSADFDFINLDEFNESEWNIDPNPHTRADNYGFDYDSDESVSKKLLEEFPRSVINPTARNKDSSNKLKFTVWNCYGCHHGKYGEPVNREFDTSYNSITEANHRVKYLFLFKSPFGDGPVDRNIDIDAIHKKMGVRYMREDFDGGSEWVVSAIPSNGYNYLVHDVSDSGSYAAHNFNESDNESYNESDNESGDDRDSSVSVSSSEEDNEEYDSDGYGIAF